MSEPAGELALSHRAEILRLSGITRAFKPGTPMETWVLKGIDLRLLAGELVALTGPSGSGKSTLLNQIGLLDYPTSGQLWINGTETAQLNDHERTELRNRAIGFVFQFHHLIHAFTVLDNVLMPLMIRHGKPSPADRALAVQLLTDMGLADHAHKPASQISGGQQQRVAIARALVTRPALLLADEPTGNLDTQSANTVFELFQHINQQYDCAILVVTHDPGLAARCQRTLTLVDGRMT